MGRVFSGSGQGTDRVCGREGQLQHLPWKSAGVGWGWQQMTKGSETVAGRICQSGEIGYSFEIIMGIPYKTSQYQALSGTNRFAWQSSRCCFPESSHFSFPLCSFAFLLSSGFFNLRNSCVTCCLDHSLAAHSALTSSQG